MIDILGFTLIGIGLAFNIFGCVGLFRLPDVYSRLQAATKCVTMGTCSILLGVFMVVGFVAAGKAGSYPSAASSWPAAMT